jgi:hypothetical protein
MNIENKSYSNLLVPKDQKSPLSELYQYLHKDVKIYELTIPHIDIVKVLQNMNKLSGDYDDTSIFGQYLSKYLLTIDEEDSNIVYKSIKCPNAIIVYKDHAYLLSELNRIWQNTYPKEFIHGQTESTKLNYIKLFKYRVGYLTLLA